MCIAVPSTGSHLCSMQTTYFQKIHNSLFEWNAQLSCDSAHTMTIFLNKKIKKSYWLWIFKSYLQDFKLSSNSWFMCCLFSLASFAFPLILKTGQRSSTASYLSSAASSSLLGLLKHLPRSTLPCHRGLAANKLLTLLAVIKSRKAFSSLSCKMFFLLTTDSPKQTLQTRNCSQTTDLTNCNQTNHYSTDKQTS